MSVHAILNHDNPRIGELLGEKRPNESDHIYDYRRANFKQYTFSKWEKALNTIARIFNPRLYSVTFPEMRTNVKEQTVKNYFTRDFPKESPTFESYYKEVIYPLSMRDPNAVIAVMPLLPLPVNSGDLVEPFPFAFESWQILDRDPNMFTLFWGHRATETKGGMGKVFLILDQDEIVVITQVGPIQDNNWAADVLFVHGLGYTPIIPVPGKITVIDEDKYNQSYFAGVLENWDEALTLNSDVQAVRVRHSFPKEWQWRIRCSDCGGNGFRTTKEGVKSDCASCGGKGTQNAHGPYDTVTLDAAKFPSQSLPREPGGYIEASTGILETLPKARDQEIEAGFDAINMNFQSKDTNVAESGVSKEIGRTDLHTFMQTVSLEHFVTYQVTAITITDMRYGGFEDANEIAPIVQPPVKFDLLNSTEIIAKIAAAKEAGVSPAIITRLELDLLERDYDENSTITRTFKILVSHDPLPNAKADELMMLASFTRPEDLHVHVNLPRLVAEVMANDPNFLDKTKPEQRAAIYELAAIELAAMAPAPMIPIQPGTGGQGAA